MLESNIFGMEMCILQTIACNEKGGSYQIELKDLMIKMASFV